MSSSINIDECRNPGTGPRAGSQSVVLKLGGAALKDEQSLANIINQVASLSRSGHRLVLVHGGGPRINQAMEAQQLCPVFINGLRVTDDDALMTVFAALGAVNAYLTDRLRQCGVRAAGLHADPCLLRACKAPPVISRGQPHDLGWVGSISSVNADALKRYAGVVAVISPIGWDENWNRYNINADEVAMALAVALGAGALVFLSDVAGVMTDMRDPATRIRVLREDTAKELIDRGIVHGGMLPKLDNSLKAIRAGVGRVCMVDGKQAHALLDVLGGSGAAGTTICA